MEINLIGNKLDRHSFVSEFLSGKPSHSDTDRIITNFRISRGEWDAFKGLCRRKYGKDASDILRAYIQHELGERNYL